MLWFFGFVREMSFTGVAVRLAFAVLCGGLIGIERESKRRSAGFRTHILICLGAAMTTLTSQYLVLVMHMYADIARLGAQVVAGVGFIGAGAIIVTKQRRVKGLTTAAGLWTGAIIGLVCGAGYVECALFCTALVLIAELVLIKFEYWFSKRFENINLYVEYEHSNDIERIIRLMREKSVNIEGMEISRVGDSADAHFYCAVLTLQPKSRKPDDSISGTISALPGVRAVEEL